MSGRYDALFHEDVETALLLLMTYFVPVFVVASFGYVRRLRSHWRATVALSILGAAAFVAGDLQGTSDNELQAMASYLISVFCITGSLLCFLFDFLSLLFPFLGTRPQQSAAQERKWGQKR